MTSAINPLNPAALPKPFANYSHGIVIPSGARIAATSGQLGIAADGSVPPGARAQAALCFAHIKGILAEAGMGMEDIVRLNAYVTDRSYMADYMAERDAQVGTPPPASTLMIVSGFTRPEFLVEIEAIAARID